MVLIGADGPHCRPLPGVIIAGSNNNISRIGLIVLVGKRDAKNAILIVRVRQGPTGRGHEYAGCSAGSLPACVCVDPGSLVCLLHHGCELPLVLSSNCQCRDASRDKVAVFARMLGVTFGAAGASVLRAESR